jgi:hypothetical protein
MDIWGIVIFLASFALYFLTKKKTIFLFTAGIGVGIVIGAIWSMSIINNLF